MAATDLRLPAAATPPAPASLRAVAAFSAALARPPRLHNLRVVVLSALLQTMLPPRLAVAVSLEALSTSPQPRLPPHRAVSSVEVQQPALHPRSNPSPVPRCLAAHWVSPSSKASNSSHNSNSRVEVSLEVRRSQRKLRRRLCCMAELFVAYTRNAWLTHHAVEVVHSKRRTSPLSSEPP